jgi:hypothetical protein
VESRIIKNGRNLDSYLEFNVEIEENQGKIDFLLDFQYKNIYFVGKKSQKVEFSFNF